jgi:putative transposase
MARKRHSDEDILKLLREIELALAFGNDVGTACRSVGISDATYYNWRRRFGGMAKSQLSEMKALEKENTRLKKIPLGGASLACRAMVPELELDKLILKENLDFLKPRA